jgi:hypothetical protein
MLTSLLLLASLLLLISLLLLVFPPVLTYVSAVVCILDVEVVSCAAAGLPLLNSYCCCFVPGVPSVAVFPTAVELSSATGVSPAVVGISAVDGSLLLWLSYCWWHTYCARTVGSALISPLLVGT